MSRNPYAIIGIPEWPEVEIKHNPNVSWINFPWRAATVVEGRLVNTVAATRRGACRGIRRAVARSGKHEPQTTIIVNMKED